MKVQIGDRFENLKVAKDTGKKGKGGRILLCDCKCGKSIEVIACSLTSGNTKSCGCLRTKKLIQRNKNRTIHNQASIKTKEYWTWCRIKQKCFNPNDVNYHSYGAKGIGMFDGWKESFVQFYKDVGKCPKSKTELDRIDGTKGYEPGNVRWVTRKDNARNRKTTKWITLDGQTRTLTDWFAILNIPKTTFYKKTNSGLSIEEALTNLRR